MRCSALLIVAVNTFRILQAKVRLSLLAVRLNDFVYIL